MLKVEVYRYNPDTDKAPYMKAYEIDTHGKDLMVLDVLELLKAQDEGLAYRRSCREGVCGSDGMNINGKNGLACIKSISEATGGSGKLVLRPLPGLPVIRDLVVDMTQFYDQYKRSSPICKMIRQRQLLSVCNRPKSARSWMVCTSVFSALAAQPAAHRSGGILTSSLAQPVCCKLIVFLQIAEIWRLKNVCPTWMTPSVYSVAMVSKTVLPYARKV